MIDPPPSSTARAAVSAATPSTPATISDFSGATRSFDPRTAPTQRNTAQVALKAQPLQQPIVHLTGRHASGAGTWYCKTGVSACHHSYPGGLYAAAGPGLRIGSWRGRAVRVCGNGNCVNVRLIDWCACGGGAHLIDLYSDAFVRLAPLSAGAVHVTVSW